MAFKYGLSYSALYFAFKKITSSNQTEKCESLASSSLKISILCLCSSQGSETIDIICLLSSTLLVSSTSIDSSREKESCSTIYNNLKEHSTSLPEISDIPLMIWEHKYQFCFTDRNGRIWSTMIQSNFSHRLFDKGKNEKQT